ncbi:O-antigen ligase family protein [Devosia sp. 1566]|uniref:O-antigen ligase family protein n=1 Tax=Devosia sp. 1566 TaxID=2499144 RepID=UPI000FDC4D06|nr:O-antigen ligase family protein [Devosia sp. 1566]
MAELAGAFAPHTGTGTRLGRSFLRDRALWLLHATVAIWVFSGGVVLFEPSPYEFSFVLVLAMALAAGMSLFSSTIPLLLLTTAFIPFGLIAAFQVRYTPLTEAFTFVAVTIFLFITSYFVANFVGEAPERRVRLIVRAYMAIAVLSAVLGVLAYLGLMPGADAFVLYGRAKGLFKDPNVYGPFLILPAMYVLRDVFFLRGGKLLIPAILFMLVMIGVFMSFSRAAWGHFALSSLLVFGLCFFLEAYARDKVRMLLLALAGLFVIMIAFAGLLSIPAVGSLFEERASVTQDYDTGDTGRFGRQGYAFDLALSHPLGLGPTEFHNLRIIEQPHNTYVTVIQAYGWGGGACYYLLVLATLWRGFRGLADRSRRKLLIPALAVFIPLALQSGVIDTDHWRHYFLVVGLIWGVTVRADPDLRLPALRKQAARGL